jgi:hypothetical protein
MSTRDFSWGWRRPVREAVCKKHLAFMDSILPGYDAVPVDNRISKIRRILFPSSSSLVTLIYRPWTKEILAYTAAKTSKLTLCLPCVTTEDGDRAIYGVGLRPLASWDWGFEYRREHGRLSLMCVVCCQVEDSASGWSLVQRSLTECGVSEYDCEALAKRRPWPTSSCRDTKIVRKMCLL